MDSKKQGFSTRILTSKIGRKDAHGAISLPIYRNAAFEFDNSVEIANAFQNKMVAHTYTRISNPSVENFEQKIKVASGAEYVLAVSSGMAAISNTFFTLAYAGCNIVTSPHLFGNTFSLLQFTLADFGVEVRFVDTDNLAQIEAAIDDNTCAFFCELITNPHMEIADLPEISKILKAKNVPMVVDTTLVPWCAFRAKDFGVDIEIVSTTKYVSGGATSVGGAILDYGTFDWSYNKKLNKINTVDGKQKFNFKLRREIGRNIGACMDSETASLQALGMDSLEVRYRQMSASAYEIAQFLSENNKIIKVGYTKLDSSPYKAVSDKLFTLNPGAMVTFSLPTKQDCYDFQDRLKIIRRATNLFDSRSLIIHPESTIYGTFSDEMKQVMDIQDNLLRLSVGLENTEDLKNDILQALNY